MISFEFLKQSPIAGEVSPSSKESVLVTQESYVSAAPLLGRDEHWTQQLTAKQLKNMSLDQRQKQEAIQEIVLAERAYVRDLRLITKVFMDEMKDRGLVTKEETASLFSNIPTLLDVHTNMLNELEQLKRDHGMISDHGLGRIFLERTNLFKHYAHYCVNYISMAQRLASLRENPKIADFLEECLKNPECRNSSFESFLITPLQRMAKYPLLLASLLKYTDAEHPEYAQLAQAYEEIKHVVDQVNNRAQQEENVRKVLELQTAVTLVHGHEAYKFCEWGRHIVKEGPVCVLQGKKKAKNRDFHLVLFNDKVALFRIKAKGKRKGYKVLHVWEGNQLICLPLEWPTTVLAQSSPGVGATPPGVVRLRLFSRNGATDAPVLSPRNPTPAHSSPRGRSVRNLRDSDVTEPIDEDCGIRVVEKDKEWMEYKLVFSSVAEKEDWVDKMKALKIEFQAAEGEYIKSLSADAVNALLWEKKYHVEVGIRTELKRVLDVTVHQLNEAREEIEALKKERETLKKKVVRLKENSKKKEQREERKELSVRANERDRVKQKKESEEKKTKDRDWLNIGGRLRSLSSEIDEVIFQRFEYQDKPVLSNSAGSGNVTTDETSKEAEEGEESDTAKQTHKDTKRSTTLGRKSLGSVQRRKERDRMLFLDLPSRSSSSTARSTDSAGRVGDVVVKPASAREPRSRRNADGTAWSPRSRGAATCALDATTNKSSPRHEALAGAEGKRSSSPRTKEHEASAGGEAKASSSPQSAGDKLSWSGSGAEKRAKAPSSKKDHDASAKKASPRQADGSSGTNNNTGVRKSSSGQDKHDPRKTSSPRKDHDRLTDAHSMAPVGEVSYEAKQLHQSS